MTNLSAPKITLLLADEQATLQLGVWLAQSLGTSALIFLSGELGAGKTTLSRGLIQALGHSGSVKSPTYTIVEPYEHLPTPVYHFDLYRLGDPEELEYLGLRDYLQQSAIVLMEWAERGGDRLPSPDISVSLSVLQQGRHAELVAHSAQGQKLLANFELLRQSA